MIRRYEGIRSQIGHTPRNSDIDPTTRYHIKKKYGCLTKLIRSIGDRPYSKRPSDDDIIAEYKRVRDLIGRTPTLEDMASKSDFSRNCFSSYPFTRLQRECGDRPNVEFGVSKRELIEAYEKLHKELGRRPTLKEIDERGCYRSSYYRRRWGSIDKFLEEARIPKGGFKKREYQKAELAIIYLLLKKVFQLRADDTAFDLNHTVLKSLKLREKVFIYPRTLSLRFGSWEHFLKYIQGDHMSQVEKRLDELVDGIIDNEPDAKHD